jgi:IclR family acetate operon transcriptional repressor
MKASGAVSKNGAGRTLSTALHALEALEYIARHPRGASVKSLARGLGLGLSSAYSVMNSLRAERFVVPSRAVAGTYTLGPRVLELYRSYVESSLQPEWLKPFLEELRDRALARAYAALWRKGDVEVAEVRGRRGARDLQDISKGFRGAAHALAMGKVYLAALPESAWPPYLQAPIFQRFSRHTMTTRGQLLHNLAAVRERSMALDLEEYADGVCSLAAPVQGDGRGPVAALGISVPVRRFRCQYKTLAGAVRVTAAAASRELESVIGAGAAGPAS